MPHPLTACSRGNSPGFRGIECAKNRPLWLHATSTERQVSWPVGLRPRARTPCAEDFCVKSYLHDATQGREPQEKTLRKQNKEHTFKCVCFVAHDYRNKVWLPPHSMLQSRGHLKRPKQNRTSPVNSVPSLENEDMCSNPSWVVPVWMPRSSSILSATFDVFRPARSLNQIDVIFLKTSFFKDNFPGRAVRVSCTCKDL